MTARLLSPGRIVVLDVADARLEKARELGADMTINNGRIDAIAEVMELTGGLGADVAIEAVGLPETFELCTDLIRPGGRVANVGVHGHPGDAPPRKALDPRCHHYDWIGGHIHHTEAPAAHRRGTSRSAPVRDASV
jgi:threonine dehydrogenase-like Zn-dependent dehydrogenase